MTSALNRRLPSSGNNLRLITALLLIWCASCSPKVKQAIVTPEPYTPPAKAIERPVSKPIGAAPAVKQKVSTIAMIMPLNLDELNSANGYKSGDLKRANMGIEYYQGFRLALDSLTANGYNYKLQLFDDKDSPVIAHSLALNPNIRNSDLIAGPVFPESIKSFTAAFSGVRRLIISPLSPVSPTTFKTPYLITATPPLSYHAQRAARYVNDRLKAKRIFVLKSGFTEDNKYIIPFRQAIDSLSRLKTKIITFTVVRGSLETLIPQFSKTESNVLLLPSVNQAFLQVTLRSVDSLSKIYPITLIGHPSWEGFSYLRPELLQRLHTVITSADHVNYKAGSTVTFIKAYRRAYHLEPTAYSIRGFDAGLYFGEMLAQTDGAALHPERADFEGLDNNFHFVKKPAVGWINTHVYILRYLNFELKAIE